MKNLTKISFLLTTVISLCFTACSKKEDSKPVSLDHKVVFKTINNPQTAVNSATYKDGSGKIETFNGFGIGGSSLWTSKEYIMSSLVKTIDFSAIAPGIPGDAQFYLNVEIWIDGEKKAEGKTTTVNNMGQLKASASYSF